jgi:glycosyltransferase involved in cell wall biosynthesis
MAHVPATIAMYAARQLGVPFSFTGHANDLFTQRSLLREKLLRSAFTACISRWHRDFYRTLADLPDSRLPIVRCGVEMPDSPLSRRRPETADFRILSVGRLVPKKGFEVLLHAVAELVRRGRPIQCRIAGNGPQRETLERLRRDLALEDAILFEGPVSNATVKTMLRDVDLFVLPCQVDASGDRDGIPVALMEAMAAGVCTVSGDLPAIRELIEHRVSGWLVPPGDAEALAGGLETLMTDDDLRAHLAEAGRRHVASEFSLNTNVDRLIDALRSNTLAMASPGTESRS